MKLKILSKLAFSFVLALALFDSTGNARSNAEQDVRRAAQAVFDNLKAKRYDALYDSLPVSSRNHLTRENFASSLRQAEDFYRLDRLLIGTVRVSGDIAVADTTMFGHILKPVDSEGKIVAQQYLVKEDGAWKVATGDRTLVQRFLAQNPDFAKKFPVRQSKVLINRDGQWIDVTTLGRARRNRT
jgi:hypothetical protein